MKIIRHPRELQQLCMDWESKGRRIGLVPTMGYFHEGHLSLMDDCRKRCDKLVVSLFVNPTQFGPGEDLETYPRDEERDARLAEEHGADVLFVPEPGGMYDPDHGTWIQVPEMAKGLCGASRPDHFRGVCTVVCKLFMLARPKVAVFGQKDWQQLAIIRRMVRDLNIPVEIAGHPIVREADGLALSSRNVYLTEEERRNAPNIHVVLRSAAEKAKSGTTNAETLKRFIRDELAAKVPGGRPDYIEIVDPETLENVNEVRQKALIAVAIFMSRARLIDNFSIEV
jgi:pantoate--beta-alanine ligase